MGIQTISIIGSGNVASHLAKALAGDIKIVSVHSRNHDTAKILAEEHYAYLADHLEQLLPADLFLVCVNDDQINEVIAQLPKSQKIAYTSGSVELNKLDRSENVGVIYPLQTFSKDSHVDFFKVPFLIEATTEYYAQELFDLAWRLSRKVIYMSSEDRKKVHLAAVMVNNFVNHIHVLAEDFLKENSVEFHYLHALIEETAKNSIRNTPALSQTGPAKRGDYSTLTKHLGMLEGDVKEIYKDLTNSLLSKHGHDKL